MKVPFLPIHINTTGSLEKYKAELETRICEGTKRQFHKLMTANANLANANVALQRKVRRRK